MSVERIEDSVSRELIFWLDSAPDSPLLGGKARMLVRLAAKGLPVPAGLVLSADALPPNAPGGDTPSLPDDVSQALASAYTELGQRLGEQQPLVAVRSSGLAEDLAEASFAGQYVTVLGVRGAREVLAAASRCWASLGSPGVAAYRAAVEQRTGNPLPVPGMAILVQVLVPAEAAGVAATRDKVNQDEDTVVIHASWGLGRSVVDGLVEGDTWRVARDSLAVREMRTGDKPVRAGLGLDAGPEPVTESLRRRPCLTMDQATEIAALALRAGAVVGEPADVEWALADGRVWLLQARPLVAPVAALQAEIVLGPSGPTPTFPFAWPTAEAATRHWRWNADDARVSEVLRPFELDVRQRNTQSGIEAQEFTGAPEVDRCLEVNGYLYYTRTPSSGTDEDRARRAEMYLRPARTLHAQGETFFGSIILPEAQAATKRLGAVDVDAANAMALAAHFEDTLHWYERAWVLHMMMDPWDEASPAGRAGKLYRELTGDQNPWALFAPFSHIPQKENLALDGLIDLARLVKGTPELLAHFQSSAPSQVLRDLDAVDGGAAFLRRLDALLKDFGLQCGASQGVMRGQVLPGWREDPSIVMALVQCYLSQDLGALARARLQSAEYYAREVKRLQDNVAQTEATLEQRAQFDLWFNALVRQVTSAVDHNHYLDSPMNALVHRALMACGRRLAAAGGIDAPEDVWWLRAHEVAAAVRSVECPQRPDWRQKVAAQKALFAWQASLTPPEYLGAPPPVQPAPPSANGEKEPLPANLLVKGMGAAPGVATGRVRMVDYRLLVPEVQPGDVFVAGDCGVLWAVLLPIATAVVLDGSNPGEHPMRVCTEFGVPGIVQAKNATQLLHEGQWVTVDGNRGWVLAVDGA